MSPCVGRILNCTGLSNVPQFTSNACPICPPRDRPTSSVAWTARQVQNAPDPYPIQGAHFCDHRTSATELDRALRALVHPASLPGSRGSLLLRNTDFPPRVEISASAAGICGPESGFPLDSHIFSLVAHVANDPLLARHLSHIRSRPCPCLVTYLPSLLCGGLGRRGTHEARFPFKHVQRP